MRMTLISAIVLITFASGCSSASGAAQPAVSSVAVLADRAASQPYLFRESGMPIAQERLSQSPESQSGTIEINEALKVTYKMILREDESVSSIMWKAQRPDRPPAEFQTVDLQQSTAAADAATVSARAVVPYFDQSVGMLARLVRYARGRGGETVEVPVHRLIDGRVLPAIISFPALDQALVEVEGKTWRLSLGPDDAVIAAQLSGYGVTVEQLHGRFSGLRPIWPPHGVPAGATYDAHQVRFSGADGVTIAGTLTVPRNLHSPAPAALMITGSGRNNRNQGTPPSMPFREIADALSSRGIVVLRVDDRGIGESSGDAATATTLDEAQDIQAAITFARARPEIDPSRVALIGWSEGGFIAPTLASADPAIAAVALLNGAFHGREIAEYQVRYAVSQNSAIPPEQREEVVADRLRRAQQHPRSAAIWSLDVTDAASRLRMPVLLIAGANDRHVPPSQALRFASSLRQAGNDDVTMALFPNLNHVLLPDPDGRVEGFPFLPSPRLPQQVVKTLADWMVERLTSPASEVDG